MKRSLVCTCILMLATALFAQDPVHSVNVVGFNKHTVEASKLYLFSSAFEDIDGKDLTANMVFGNQLPNGTRVTYYDGVGPYVSDTRTVAGWSSKIKFHGAMGFWVKVPTLPGPNYPYELILKGQVPMADEACYLLAQGLNMLGYPFTADVAFTNTQLYAGSVIGDQIHLYNPTTCNYTGYDPATSNFVGASYTKLVTGWPAGARALVLKQGNGFWYRNAGDPRTVCEQRPYAVNSASTRFSN